MDSGIKEHFLKMSEADYRVTLKEYRQSKKKIRYITCLLHKIEILIPGLKEMEVYPRIQSYQSNSI